MADCGLGDTDWSMDLSSIRIGFTIGGIRHDAVAVILELFGDAEFRSFNYIVPTIYQ